MSDEKKPKIRRYYRVEFTEPPKRKIVRKRAVVDPDKPFILTHDSKPELPHKPEEKQ